MKRDIQKGWWCRKCEGVKSLYHKECRCMTFLTEADCAKHRARYWYPFNAEIEVTMAGAQR